MKKTISIIIPTIGNSELYLLKCIRSIKKYTQSDDEYDINLIIVSNGSTQKDVFDILLEHSENINISVLHTFKKLGYATAINKGVRFSNSDYIILLNDDTEILESLPNTWIKYLIDSITDKNNIVGPLLKYETEINKYFVIFFCVAMKKEVFEKVGYLDENFLKGYCEDMDFCIRAQKLGYNIAVAPLETKVEYNGFINTGIFPIYHKGSGTFERLEDDASEIYNNNFNLLKQKHSL